MSTDRVMKYSFEQLTAISSIPSLFFIRISMLKFQPKIDGRNKKIKAGPEKQHSYRKMSVQSLRSLTQRWLRSLDSGPCDPQRSLNDFSCIDCRDRIESHLKKTHVHFSCFSSFESECATEVYAHWCWHCWRIIPK